MDRDARDRSRDAERVSADRRDRLCRRLLSALSASRDVGAQCAAACADAGLARRRVAWPWRVRADAAVRAEPGACGWAQLLARVGAMVAVAGKRRHALSRSVCRARLGSRCTAALL